MKKNTTPLKLTKTTIRVLRDAELATVQGGAERPSKDPAACRVGGYYLVDGGEAK